MATIILDAGLRPDECFRLQWENVKWIDDKRAVLIVPGTKTEAASRIVPMTVIFPGRLRHQRFKRLVVRIGDQITRALPSLDVVRGISPRSAWQIPVALQKFQIHWRLVEPETLE